MVDFQGLAKQSATRRAGATILRPRQRRSPLRGKTRLVTNVGVISTCGE